MKTILLTITLLVFCTEVQAQIFPPFLGTRDAIRFRGNAANIAAAHMFGNQQSGPIVIAYPPQQQFGYPQQQPFYYPQQQFANPYQQFYYQQWGY